MTFRLYYLIFATAVLLGSLALFYLWSRFRRFEWMPVAKRRKNLVALLPVALLTLWWLLSLNGLLVILYLAMAWLICDLLFLPLRKKKRKRYYAGYLAIFISILHLSYGYLACHCVTMTHYTLVTSKALGQEKLRIALFADAHLGTVFGGEKMAEYLAEIESHHPDVLVIAGDLVDDGTHPFVLPVSQDLMLTGDLGKFTNEHGTPHNEWQDTLLALKKFHAPLGKYFIFGNHDQGFARRNNLPDTEIRQNLESAGVRVLEDETAALNACVDLIGRRDRWQPRKTAEQLLASLNAAHYRLILNHQPTDYANESAAKADLVLSGHTHGGQLWSLQLLVDQKIFNDSLYGLTRLGKTDFIVTSGIADWKLDFKTGCKSEYVIIDVVSTTQENH